MSFLGTVWLRGKDGCGRAAPITLVLLMAACASADPGQPDTRDVVLRRAIAEAGVTPLAPVARASDALDRLGQALFFDKILSGNRDIGCSTCHNPAYHTSDQLTLSIGTGGQLPGGSRQLGTGRFTARNALDLFDRGQPSWRSLTWDGRIEVRPSGLVTPLGASLPAGVTTPLAAQALLPLAARIEMRGTGSDELATLPDTAVTAIYAGIVARLQAIPGYDTLFAAAYPGLPAESMAIAHVVNALAAFISDRWGTGGTPFDRYLRGDSLALGEAERRGAELFFGRARCAQCHDGPLLTDQQFHNTGVPVLGPGLLTGGPDIGRGAISGNPSEDFFFRTPPLRNAALTPPFMHNGSFATLEDVVRHYRNVAQSLATFDPATVDPRLRPTLDLSPATVQRIQATLDPRLTAGITLSDQDVSDLVAFLNALIDPASTVLLNDIPGSVPSGLDVHDF